ncbi:MAG: hypothetical protein AB4426_26070 [Xenococcaceae cyanobacterium]
MSLKNLQVIKNGRVQRRILELLIAALIGFFLSLWGVEIRESVVISGLGAQPATAQTLRPELVAAQVYQRFPDLPQENQYIKRETGEVAPDNTLVSRLIRYHQYVKNRPIRFRLDWKLTLADYLGVNEPLRESRYPGKSTLQTNPMESDRKAISSLNRRQRNELVDLLVSIYNPKVEDSSVPNPSPQTTPETSDSTPKPRLSLPQPGGAELLMP